MYSMLGEEAQIGEQFVAQILACNYAFSIVSMLCYLLHQQDENSLKRFSRNAKIVSAGYETFSASI